MHQYESHTTVPDPVTITTENKARLTIEDYTRCVVQVVNHSTGSDGIKHESVSEGKFIVLSHGFNYVDHRPRSVWLELSPIVDDDDPNGWCEDLDEVEIRTAAGIIKKLALTQSFSSLPLDDDERALLVALRDATVPPTGVTEKIS